ncbi:MAG: T9SS type A sorting domain-containing protein [Bacteroidota bacterium]
MKFTTLKLFVAVCLIPMLVQAQQQSSSKASSVEMSSYVREIPPLSKMDNIISASGFEHKAPPKRRGKNTVVPGKGLPKGEDPLMVLQQSMRSTNFSTSSEPLEPLANFIAHQGTVLNDPTGAIGPNHYVYAFNSGFGILDRAGNVLLPEASLATLFPNEDLGDPIVMYDNYADRFIIMQFSNTPNGILIAVCRGADPINNGWYTYRFNTGSFPDYEKLSIWSDGYYITANKDSFTAGTSEVVFAVDRDKMLLGQPAAMIGFPLPGITTSGFYSPGGLNSTGADLPPAGVGHQIIYMQDDAWFGVDRDHLKIWTTTVDWSNPTNSSIELTQELNTIPFDGVLDGGSFQNIDEPGPGPDIDALQATMMFMTNYRRFPSYNTVTLNFAIDISGDDTRSGIRWMELRQPSDGAPWTAYQEGTYIDPNGHSAFSGSINMDAQGNIGLGYTIASTTQFTSIRYTGRMADDPLGVMTIGEGFVVDGDARTNRFDGRYGDYAQLTMDPTNDLTFWHIGEYMQGEPATVRKSQVVAFQLAPDFVDSVPPTPPHSVYVTGVTAGTTTLNWFPSSDNVGVVGYEVYDGTTLLAKTGTGNKLLVTDLTPSTSYKMFVVAVDGAGNRSKPSNIVDINTAGTPEWCQGIATFPYLENFEGSTGEWTQTFTNDDLDWQVQDGPTPTEGTGPDEALAGDFYIYVDAAGNANKQAIITSPCFNFYGISNPFFTFRYHMFGEEDLGSLSLEISTDGGFEWTTLWIESGNQGNAWNTASIDLSAYVGNSARLRFNRMIGSSKAADVALEYITITDGDGCFEDEITLSITLDNFPQETSWVLEDASGVVASNSYSIANPDGSTVVEEIGALPEGDYIFTIDDTFGDGICCGFGLGSYALFTSAGDTIISGGEFARSESVLFCINGSSGARQTNELPLALETHDLSFDDDLQYTVYPNPVTDVLSINQKEQIEKVMVFSMYGQVVEEVQFDKKSGSLEVSNLSDGLYFIRIYNAEDQIITRKFVKE